MDPLDDTYPELEKAETELATGIQAGRLARLENKAEQKARLGTIITALKKQEGLIDEFDAGLWGSMVKFVTVGRSKEITVTFRDGTEIMA